MNKVKSATHANAAATGRQPSTPHQAHTFNEPLVQAQSIEEQSQLAIPATGYLADNWSGFSGESAALVVNPKASSLELLSWCWGEVRSLQSVAQLLGTAGELIEPGDLAAIFQHRLDPLAEVMRLAMDALHAAHRASVEGASGA